MMYDELIKRLRKTSIDFGELDHVSVMMIEAANAIAELQKDLERSKDFEAFWQHEAEEALKKFQIAISNKPHWIPVTDRLPENQCDVLCNDEGRVVFGYYTDEKVGWHDFYSYEICPTHWMPLPEPPKSDDSLSFGICDDPKQKESKGET